MLEEKYQNLLEQFEQGELYLEFLEKNDFLCKKMFGGLACYLNGLMVSCLVEGESTDTKWKNKDYGIPLWRGILLPTDFPFQSSLQTEIPSLQQHPILKKWLYLPLETETYEKDANKLIRLIKLGDPRIGVVGSKKRSSSKKTNKVIKSSKISKTNRTYKTRKNIKKKTQVKLKKELNSKKVKSKIKKSSK
jgi:hypothetical protein